MVNTQTILARFKGEGSLGYRSGGLYLLYTNQERAKGFEDAWITITRSDGSGLCPYESSRSFYANWEVVEVTPVDRDD